jgi:outer membrane putative beta-barrel porin/alpha-amylase
MRPRGLGSIALGAALMLGASVVAAEDDDRIPTDRPSLSNSTQTVPPGKLQIESGVEYSRSRVSHGETEQQLLVDILFRTGITSRVEARLDINPLVWLKDADTDVGFGDITLAVKYRFLDSPEGGWWPSLGVLPFVKLPTARSPLGSERVDIGCTGLATFDLPWALSLDLNVGLAGIGQSEGAYFLLQETVSAALSRQITYRFAAYGELFYSSPSERHTRDVVGFDAGVQYLILPRVAIDMAAQVARGTPGPDFAIRAGLSVRFGR